MSIVKSLLLGSAAGLVAVASAQAADLPMKAKAVDYVKVCDAYGAGFYYIPGTDICLKVGGYVRADTYYGMVPGYHTPLYPANALTGLAPGSGAGGDISYDRQDDLTAFRSRIAVTMDARTRTEYGTLRAYGLFYTTYDYASGTGRRNWQDQGFGGASAGMDRAFIQFAGFTFGYLQSFFDYSAGLGTFTTINVGSNKFTNVVAYTASLGNGLSATIGVEDATYRRNAIQVAPGTVTQLGTTTVFDYTDATNYQGGQAMPDIVANIRVDQSWGSAQLSGAIHQLRAADAYDNLGNAFLPATADINETDYGYAIGAGITFNLDSLAKGDQFMVQGSYASGATEYTGVSSRQTTSGPSALGMIRGATGAIVDLADAFINPVDGSIEQVDAWTIRADFRHFWTPSLRSTLFGGYSAVEVPFIDGITAGSPLNLGAGTEDSQTVRDFNLWQVGFNTTWSPVKNLDIGVEMLYTKVDVEGFKGYTAANMGTQANADRALSYSHDEDIFSGMVRVQRNF
ncbi:porin [Blastochloris sulfoviridis]|uniref:Porin n=1 Tax=Blastochloris sulfoviridis TaxID=50712 RepID=A0A5M6HSR5_9HYPH|nr:porin [Blastochloris sulfoviridis]KAA5598953.1 porin [Blastochloris sulfoviridis]